MATTTCFFLLAMTLLIAFASANSNEVQFSYKDSNGPANWGRLSPNFSACSSGKMQSPINIIKNDAVTNKNLLPLTRYYKPANATLVNDGIHLGVYYQTDCGQLVAEGKNYTLKEMHWHVPSEHQIDGQQLAAELHLVHKADNGDASVVSILFEDGDPDPFLSKIQDKLNELAKDVCSEDEEARVALGYLDNKLLKKNTRTYYRYTGSFTSPPCTENVVWNILGKVRTISKEQVEALKAPLGDAYKSNARPVQALNGRKVDLYDELSS